MTARGPAREFSLHAVHAERLKTGFDFRTQGTQFSAMQATMATILVFLSGFTIMVLEIIGARFLAKDFGSAFYVWVSQIGVVLIALALGYWAGGALADRVRRMTLLAGLVVSAGVVTVLIPDFSAPLIDALIQRHPGDQPIPPLWQKLDPAFGSALVFLLPCAVLAMLPPCMIRMATRHVAHVGRVSGLIIAASTVGSIAGVFVAGYVLIDHFRMSAIFRGTGGLIVLLGLLVLVSGRKAAETRDPSERQAT